MTHARLFRPNHFALSALSLSLLALPLAIRAQTEINIPVLVPVTGFLALEGTSQRNGALLAIKNAPASVKIKSEVSDTGSSPEKIPIDRLRSSWRSIDGSGLNH